jgi:hypothetical protein
VIPQATAKKKNRLKDIIDIRNGEEANFAKEYEKKNARPEALKCEEGFRDSGWFHSCFPRGLKNLYKKQANVLEITLDDLSNRLAIAQSKIEQIEDRRREAEEKWLDLEKGRKEKKPSQVPLAPKRTEETVLQKNFWRTYDRLFPKKEKTDKNPAPLNEHSSEKRPVRKSLGSFL